MATYLDGNSSTTLIKNKDKPTKRELAMKATREKWARNSKRGNQRRLMAAKKGKTSGNSGG